MKRLFWLGITTAAVMFVAVPQAQASAILPLVLNNNLPANDDGSTGLVPIGFSINFFGVNFSNLYVNNNGNVTFNAPLGVFTPSGITAGSQPTMAPFWADVDTRYSSGQPGNIVTYGNGTVNGHNAFLVDWVNVGYYQFSPTAARDSFQLVIVDRSDVAPGDFDFMFNYDQMQWESGQASGSDAAGCGGIPAHVGWTNGDGNNAHFMEFAGSGISGAFLDPRFCGSTGGPNQLTTHDLNSTVLGDYTFNVRGGVVVDPNIGQAPEPASLALLGTGLIGLAIRFRKAVKK